MGCWKLVKINARGNWENFVRIFENIEGRSTRNESFIETNKIAPEQEEKIYRSVFYTPEILAVGVF